jgi:hypothetical protein
MLKMEEEKHELRNTGSLQKFKMIPNQEEPGNEYFHSTNTWS